MRRFMQRIPLRPPPENTRTSQRQGRMQLLLRSGKPDGPTIAVHLSQRPSIRPRPPPRALRMEDRPGIKVPAVGFSVQCSVINRPATLLQPGHQEDILNLQHPDNKIHKNDIKMRLFYIDIRRGLCLTVFHRNVAWDGIARQAPATSEARFPMKGSTRK